MVVAVEDTSPNSSGTSVSAPSSPWLKKVTNSRPIGCERQPWICDNGGKRFPPRVRMLCCRNRCVDVMTDVNNCGFCGIKCLFSRKCCNGLCVDTNVNPVHCGRCWNRCPSGVLCFYGLCGYAEPALPPFPFASPPRTSLTPKRHLPATP
ncbi:stigma-specific STIG1-like protein 4 [Macadamia integrifolia]|uniref:stigma-specific STIG1-like protein 4 n=1 Tax=Macadamia integrifolia TaxID=60698 RepID=UPI001C4EC2C4|nr:stigma-specific STIG1-like protein 4 [Macadamia integrifolia]